MIGKPSKIHPWTDPMFCIKCGTNNSDEAVYCQKCGVTLESEEETRVAARSADAGSEEKQIFSIGPTLMFVKIGYLFAVIGAFLVVSIFAVFLPTVSWFIAILVGLLLLLIPAFYHIRRKLVRYTLTDTTIEIDTGLISRTTQNVPLRRVQDVTVSSTLTQRLLGFGNVVIDNASEDGGKVVLNNINSPKKYADALLKQMRELEK